MAKIDTLFSYKKYIIFGATSSAINTINFLSKYKKEVVYILDNDIHKIDQSFMNIYEIKSPNYLEEHFDEDTVVIISSAYQLEIFEQLSNQYKIPTQNIFPYIDQLMYDVYSNINYKENELKQICKLFADDYSKEYFLSILKFRTSLNLQDIKPLNQCKEQYIHYSMNCDNLFNAIIDVGAYNGDSLKVFKNSFSNVNKIYCIEPMNINFKELVKNIQIWEIDNAIAIQYAIADKDNIKVYFEKSIDLNSTAQIIENIQAKSSTYVLTKTLDTLFKNQNIDLIKMDIEGYELKALDGAKQIIKEQNPNLIISAYHLSNDIIEIVNKVLSYNKNYNLYCMHHPLAIHEIEYYFINNKSLKMANYA